MQAIEQMYGSRIVRKYSACDNGSYLCQQRKGEASGKDTNRDFKRNPGGSNQSEGNGNIQQVALPNEKG